jgi:large subunit ribosomal protein L24
VKKEAAIHISNLSLIDPKSGETTRVGFELRDGKKVRYSKKSNEVI